MKVNFSHCFLIVFYLGIRKKAHAKHFNDDTKINQACATTIV